MNKDIKQYNSSQQPAYKVICDALAKVIYEELPEAESKIWHAHPVWFLDGNPTVGYSRQSKGIRLMFWSGADFDEPGLSVIGGKFKDASVFYNEPGEIDKKELRRWLQKSRKIQWDYKNIVKRKGKLVRLDENTFLSVLAAPAQRALQNAGIKNLKQLSTYSEKEVLELHGMGKSSLPKLAQALKESGMAFKSPAKKSK